MNLTEQIQRGMLILFAIFAAQGWYYSANNMPSTQQAAHFTAASLLVPEKLKKITLEQLSNIQVI